ncbi:MAG TPA: 4'-phosphopantetheinyl transferase superfamily protein [Pyrinomonadaceae bacterium]|nr:4'-phosphopantetheinyl transferase superfamily protein [Pyrinomonadaceae bacterium]
MEPPPESAARFRKLLATDELTKADRFRFEKDQRHYSVARGVLRELIARYLGVAATDLRFSYTEYGKPELISPNIPQLKFNLAHSGKVALYAFTYVGDVGVDVELIRPEFTGDDIARRYFSATELQALNALPETDRTLAFFNCWARKEAVIKAKGMGLSMGLDQFDVTLTPGKPALLLRTAWDEAEVGRWSLRAIDVGSEYAAAIAIQAHDWQPSFFDYK